MIQISCTYVLNNKLRRDDLHSFYILAFVTKISFTFISEIPNALIGQNSDIKFQSNNSNTIIIGQLSVCVLCESVC